MLALLLLRANEPVAADQLVEQLWDGKPPATAANTLQHYVSELRKLLPADTLVTQPPGYVLRVEPEQIDLCRFERAVDEGRQALEQEQAARASELLDGALGLWRGPALADFAYEGWAAQEAQRLEELRLDAVETRVEARLALGQQNEVVAELQTLVAQQPLRERLRRQLMLALYRSGRQAEALEAYQRARDTLVEELGIDPSSELQALYKQILNQDEAIAAPAAVPSQTKTYIPVPPTPLLGRERELRELEHFVDREDVRLLTLTGPGGVGKTRLVLALARSRARDLARPIVFVDLSATTDVLLALSTIARALGLDEESGESPLDAIVRHLGDHRLLLVLDNLEQLGGFAPAMARMLSAAEGLKVVATSRVRLGLQAEHEMVIPPFRLPDLKEHDASVIRESEAVAFFCARAQAAQRSFTLTDENALSVARLCASLDGLPLALELAAARVKLFSPEALQARLGRRLAILGSGAADLPLRHRTLWNAIGWSHDLLDQAEQRLFRRLGLFAGGWTIEAAAAVCTVGDEGVALELLSSLIDKSLVTVPTGQGGEPRFSMLETIRAYALEQLEESGDGDAFGRRHLDFFLDLAETTDERLSGPTEADALRQLADEHENLRAALEYTRMHGLHAAGLQLAVALGDFWLLHGDLSEARYWLEALLAQVGDTLPELRAKGLHKTGRIAFTQGELDRAQACFAESLSLYESIGDLERVGVLLGNLGAAKFESGATEVASTLFARSLAIAQELGDTAGVAYAYNNLGEAAVAAGDLEAAEKYFADSLALLAEIGHQDRVAASLLNTGRTALEGGQPGRAFELILQALRLLCELGERIPEVPSGLAQLARASVELGNYPLATRLIGAAEHILGEGIALLPSEASDLARLREAVRDELGEAAFLELLAAGRALSMEELIEQAASARAATAERHASDF